MATDVMDVTDVDEFENAVAELHDQLLRVSDCLEMGDPSEANTQFELAQQYMEQMQHYITAIQAKIAEVHQADPPTKPASVPADNTIDTIKDA